MSGSPTSKERCFDLSSIRHRHDFIEQSTDKMAAARGMSYLSHLDRMDLLEEVERLRNALAQSVETVRSLMRPVETSGNTDLQWLDEWLAAYPLDVFPLPDFRQAADVLRKAGLSIDCISAANYRHVLNRVKERISAVETAPLPLGFVTIEECAGCGVRDRPNARHTDICPAAAGELVRPVNGSAPISKSTGE